MAEPRAWLLVRRDERVDADRQPLFLHLRRVTTAVEDAAGHRSAEGTWDFVERPSGLDAVVVVVYRRALTGVEVLLRSGVRVPASLGRPEQPRGPGRHPVELVEELVAGLVEGGEATPEGRRARARQEVLEEAGIDLPLDAVTPLGGALWMSPGVTADLMHYFAADATDAPIEGAPGDGSPFESVGEIAWYPLAAAIARVRDEIAGFGDLRTEVGLRRLSERLGSP
jgi:hypothetical protein